MGPGYFIIAILGCADGSTACTPVATVPTRYESQAACSAGIGDALAARNDFDFPTMVAECRPSATPAAASNERPEPTHASVQRG